MITYQIAKCKDNWVLWSVVPTNFAGDAKNYVCAGTKEYCEKIKQQLEQKDESI